LVAKAKILAGLYAEVGVQKEKLLFRCVPTAWFPSFGFTQPAQRLLALASLDTVISAVPIEPPGHPRLWLEMGMPHALHRVPATLSGIKAAEELERAGLACHLYMVYRCVKK